MLPLHLRNSDDVLGTYGWVNTIKIPNQRDFIDEMSKLGLKVACKSQMDYANENLYRFDPLCPKLVQFHIKAREKLAMSNLVQKFHLIFLVSILHKT